jgi:sensor histidine kinase YesM
LVGWYYFFDHGHVQWNKVFEATLIIMICVIFITHVYETVFLVKQTETDKVKKEQLERSKAEAELQALKNQIDPHFIFNSLNTLSYLIEEKPQKARQFNDSLADVYRYILHNKERTLVLLGEEMDFMNDYFLLLKIRFENAVQLKNELDEMKIYTWCRRSHCRYCWKMRSNTMNSPMRIHWSVRIAMKEWPSFGHQ